MTFLQQDSTGEYKTMQHKLLVLMLDDFVCGHDGQHRHLLDGLTPSFACPKIGQAEAVARDFVHSFTRLCQNARTAECETARAHFQSLMLACERSFIVACAQGHVRIQSQALAWMEAGDREGLHLGLGSRLSHRMICALMEQVLSPNWAHRFSVVATAAPFPVNEEQEDLYDVILRKASVPADETLLITTSEPCEELARRMGMDTILLN